MSEIQKVIKYIAIAFGLFLTITIISAILHAVLAISGIAFLGINSSNSKVYTEEEIKFTDSISQLEIELERAKLEIKEGSEFKVEIYNKHEGIGIATEKDSKIIIQENNTDWLFSSYDVIPEIIISIPKHKTFENTFIKTGISNVNIETLTTEHLKLEMGVGNIKGDKITASGTATINGGARKITNR